MNTLIFEVLDGVNVMKKWILTIAILMNLSSSLAAELMAMPISRTVRDVVEEQCTDVGGKFTGVCSCGIDTNPLDITLKAVAVVKAKKMDAKTFNIINPFITTCTQGIDLSNQMMREKVSSRLSDILLITHAHSVKSPELLVEIEVLLELNLLQVDNILKYVTDNKFKKKVRDQLDDLQAKADKYMKNISSYSLKSEAKNRLKKNVIGSINDEVGFDIEVALKILNTVRDSMPQRSMASRMNREEALQFVKGLRGSAKTLAKEFGQKMLVSAKTGLSGVVRGAVIASAAALTGYNMDWLAYLDPLNLLVETITPRPAMANTRTGSLAENPTRMFDTESFIMKDSTDVYFRKTVDFVMNVGEKDAYEKFTHNVMMIGLFTDIRGEAQSAVTAVASMIAD